MLTVKILQCSVVGISWSNTLMCCKYKIRRNDILTYLMICGWFNSLRMLISVINAARSSSESLSFETIFTAALLPVPYICFTSDKIRLMVLSIFIAVQITVISITSLFLGIKYIYHHLPLFKQEFKYRQWFKISWKVTLCTANLTTENAPVPRSFASV